MAIKSKARHDLTLRSIKREIAAGRDVAYWLDKAYTHLDSGLLTGDDITEVETLAQAYYDALDAEDKATLRKSRSKENIMSSTAYAHVRFLDGTLADYQTERTTNHETFKR